MPDQDLGGDDLKQVSYSILFTKPDLEATLQEPVEELLSYSTNPVSFGATKIAQFMGKAAQGEVKPPANWEQHNYPPASNVPGWTIPDEDQRYVNFVFEVVRRLPKESADYPKQQVQILREISAKLG